MTSRSSAWREDPATDKQLALLERLGSDARPATKGEASDLISELKGPGPTYRERREAKADRLREWADGREAKADASYAASRAATEHIPFGQPILVGHHSERGHRRDLARSHAAMGRMVEHGAKASDFRSRADNIEAAARRSIYSDDPDAVERLRAKLADLEGQRERIKAKNAEFRKQYRAELKALDSAYARDRAMPYPGYVLQNLGGNIGRTRKRLAQLEATS